MAWGKDSTFLSYWSALYKGTESELCLDPAVAKLGRRYRFQHPFFGLGIISDFALMDEKIVFEVDGKSHRAAKQIEKDKKHTARLEKMGWVVARCTNEEAQTDPDKAVKMMYMAAVNRKSQLGHYDKDKKAG